jgi:hypothetical protein
MNNSSKKEKKKYRVIAKVDNTRFVKYNCSNLLSFVRFLDANFDGWRWFNVYDKESKVQIANFTCKNRPRFKYI